MTDRRSLVLGLGASAVAPGVRAQERPSFQTSGRAVQGGCLIVLDQPRATVIADGERVRASERGYVVVGLDRDAPASIRIARTDGDARAIAVAPGDFDIQRIDGLPQNTVTPEDPETLAKIAREATRKAAGFASNIDADHFRAGFTRPLVATRVSGKFGGQRILNGTPARPHYGADLAAPAGTRVNAPCAGVVSFAETGLHYEGGLVMIDHGQGLVTAYLHLSKVHTRQGQTVQAGDKIGEVGAEGRATGPHLCWRMKWRGRNLDPTLMVGVKAPGI